MGHRWNELTFIFLLSFHYDVGNEDVFERAIKPRSARFLETMAGSTRSGRLEQDKISGHILGEILPNFGSILLDAQIEKWRLVTRFVCENTLR